MCDLEGICRAIRFIEQGLGDPMTVQDIAAAAGYSLYHFTREFSRLTGHSPYDYLIRRRLSESAHALFESDRRIIDIAVDYQFDNPETYSRAFRRMFGVLPSEARQGKLLNNRPRSAITPAYIRHINKGDYLIPQRVERGATHLIGMAAWVNDIDGANALWDQFESEIRSIPYRLSSERYQVSFFSAEQERQRRLRLVGVAVESLECIPLLMVGKTLPALNYARFVHKGRSADLNLTLDYIYQTWLPKSGNALAAPIEIQLCGARYIGPDHPQSESDILIPIQ